MSLRNEKVVEYRDVEFSDICKAGVEICDETLTDGSHVFNVRAVIAGGEELVCFATDEQHANDVFKRLVAALDEFIIA